MSSPISSRHTASLRLLRWACSGALFAGGCVPADPTGPSAGPGPISLADSLGPDETRAGLLRTGMERALSGGTSGEARLLDYRIYNEHVSFVIQGARQGHYYFQEAGGVIDADIIRPASEPGADFLDEHTPVNGLGIVAAPSSIEVLSAGGPGEVAHIRVLGPDSSLSLLTGALESPDLFSPYGAEMQTDYVLEPGSWALRIETTIRNTTNEEIPFQPGDLMMYGAESAQLWAPGSGFTEDLGVTQSIVAAMGHENELALALFSDVPLEQPGGGVLSQLGAVLAGSGPSQDLAPGEEATWVRWLGVGPDIATLQGERLRLLGADVAELSGRVLAAGQPVAGARVHISGGDGPESVAVTNDDGRWSALVPPGDWSLVSTARGRGVYPGGSWALRRYGVYASPHADGVMRAAAAADPRAFRVARGHSPGTEVSVVASAGGTVEVDLELPAVGHVALRVLDGHGNQAPARVVFDRVDGDIPSIVAPLAPSSATGSAAVAYTIGAPVAVPLPPGRYVVRATRGLQYEWGELEVQVAAGATEQLTLTVPKAFEFDGWVTADPHSHAAPSPDGEVSVSDRLVVSAASGVSIHVATEHDHIADYSAMVSSLGLDSVLSTIPGEEFSPILRGHVNLYPAQPRPGARNGGALPWWEWTGSETSELLAHLRSVGAANAVLQLNHPASGLPSLAGYRVSNGEVSISERWSEDFDAMEVLNSASWREHLPFYNDMLSRGLRVLPTGVSDAHGHESGRTGRSITWLPRAPGVDASVAVSNAFQAGEVIASSGAALRVAVQAGEAVGGLGSSLVGASVLVSVEVFAASWLPVDRLELWRNGEVVQTAEVPDEGVDGLRLRASFSDTPERDAVYYLVAASDRSAGVPFSGHRGIAVTAPFYLDLAGDGWEAPRSAVVAR